MTRIKTNTLGDKFIENKHKYNNRFQPYYIFETIFEGKKLKNKINDPD